jgi:hypothetical protein
MCVWHSGDIPKSTNVVDIGAAQKRHAARPARCAANSDRTVFIPERLS